MTRFEPGLLEKAVLKAMNYYVLTILKYSKATKHNEDVTKVEDKIVTYLNPFHTVPNYILYLPLVKNRSHYLSLLLFRSKGKPHTLLIFGRN
jgi:hypothetical protein